MPTLSQLAPQIAALVAVITAPVVCAYLGLRGACKRLTHLKSSGPRRPLPDVEDSFFDPSPAVSRAIQTIRYS